MGSVVVIPSRMGASRFPGKPLADLCGKPMVRWVWEAAVASGVSDRVVVATPDAEIVQACRAFGAESVLTRPDHVSGTDRIAEVAKAVPADFYVNVQGDEPLIAPESIAACAAPMLEDPALRMATVHGLCRPEDEDDPAAVKVVTDLQGYALYFSRYPIPFARNQRVGPLKKHVGLYAYRRDVLLAFSTWAPTPLERAESLEQLRFMENGVRIKVAEAHAPPLAVDTPEQAEEVRRILAESGLSR